MSMQQPTRRSQAIKDNIIHIDNPLVINNSSIYGNNDLDPVDSMFVEDHLNTIYNLYMSLNATTSLEALFNQIYDICNNSTNAGMNNSIKVRLLDVLIVMDINKNINFYLFISKNTDIHSDNGDNNIISCVKINDSDSITKYADSTEQPARYYLSEVDNKDIVQLEVGDENRIIGCFSRPNGPEQAVLCLDVYNSIASIQEKYNEIKEENNIENASTSQTNEVLINEGIAKTIELSSHYMSKNLTVESYCPNVDSKSLEEALTYFKNLFEFFSTRQGEDTFSTDNQRKIRDITTIIISIQFLIENHGR